MVAAVNVGRSRYRSPQFARSRTCQDYASSARRWIASASASLNRSANVSSAIGCIRSRRSRLAARFGHPVLVVTQENPAASLLNEFRQVVANHDRLRSEIRDLVRLHGFGQMRLVIALARNEVEVLGRAANLVTFLELNRDVVSVEREEIQHTRIDVEIAVSLFRTNFLVRDQRHLGASSRGSE